MMTADELRAKIVETSLENGGHLASSLGAVEIAMALVEVFNPQKDRVVWDVGHQAYAWKLLTGRAERFDTLRKFGGVSPFPLPSESDCDAAVAGHAGVSLSVAEGFAAARDLKGTDEQVVAVIGDSAFANGTIFEALNNCQQSCSKVILILNDNGMSISSPTGALARVLGKVISGVRYNRVKAAAEAAGHRLKLSFLRDIYHRIESRVKGLVLGNAYFERFGVRYIGPIDGHELTALVSAFTVAKEDKRSVVVHVVTKKGRGYAPAEADPTRYHGVSGRQTSSSGGKSWSDAFGDALCDLAAADKRIVALTAGMKDGTGLVRFAEKFPDRFHDVGIAEGHMVAYAAGLAAGGMRPVIAVYSTFLQRAFDQVMHDVAISSLPVVFAVDRAGVVGADGITHQGLYDIAAFKCLPNLTIVQPKDEADLRELLKAALERQGPTIVRYPRGKCPAETIEPLGNSAAKISIWSTGDMLGKANELARRLGNAEVVFARSIHPFDGERLADCRRRGMKIVSLENGTINGGFGESIGADLRFGWPDEFIPHGSVAELENHYSLDIDSLVRLITH